MRASLDNTLLMKMLKRGGWAINIKNSLSRETPYSRAWLLSQYLSRQCALASGWTGNGFDAEPAIVEYSSVDFTGLVSSNVTSDSPRACGLIFAATVCGRFLCVAQDNRVLIYSLHDGLLLPVTSVTCPRRVLSVSIDFSSARRAVAVLLEGRMGMVCELHSGFDTEEPVPNEAPNEGGSHSSQHLESFDAVVVWSNHDVINLRRTASRHRDDRNLINQTWNLHLSGPKAERKTQQVPIKNGACTFYPHLCFEDDPPRSVSICPQRRCVAFGCSAGIELQWVDAQTGQDLGRWFPLSAPSDYLSFLPTRLGGEPAKTLRITSSTAQPAHRRTVSSSTAGLFWEPPGCFRSSRHDYFQAVPLSDGYHVLFVDRANRLVLGCCPPLREDRKLLIRAILISPCDLAPNLYTVASNMTQGARIVVAYNDVVMLYSVPSDVCNASQIEQEKNIAPHPEEFRTRNHWANWWEDSLAICPANRHEGEGIDSVWPVWIRGTEIGRLSGIYELAVQATPDILIWAFSHSLQGKTWRMRRCADSVSRRGRYVHHSGIVYDCVDGSGDILVESCAPTSPTGVTVDRGLNLEKSAIPGVDGNVSGAVIRYPKALAMENDGNVDSLDVRGFSEAWFEGSGDVVVVRGTEAENRYARSAVLLW